MKIISNERVYKTVFQFTAEELQEFGLESERLDYMEAAARSELKQRGMPNVGGTYVCYPDEYQNGLLEFTMYV